MVVCSCNEVSTEEIENAVKNIDSPTVKKVIKELNWESNCAACVNSLVDEIEKIMERSNEL